MNKDIVIKDQENGYNFNFRVAGIFVNKNKILLQKSKNDEYYSLIGGRVKYGETTIDALIREIQEEIAINITKEEAILVNVIENFFTYNKNYIHEILFIYKIENNIEVINTKEFPVLDKEGVINKWFDIANLDGLDIRPNIIRESIYKNNLSHDIIQ